MQLSCAGNAVEGSGCISEEVSSQVSQNPLSIGCTGIKKTTEEEPIVDRGSTCDDEMAGLPTPQSMFVCLMLHSCDLARQR